MRQTLTAIIVDDDEYSIVKLEEQIKLYCPEVTIIGTYDDAILGNHKILELRPDVVFLDIQMPKRSGLEIAREVIQEGIHVIFITAYRQYAIDAIRLSAFDYLLKPLQEMEELISAIRRVKESASVEKTVPIFEQLLENERNESYSQETEIKLYDDRHIYFHKVKEIIRLKAHGNYCEFFFTNGEKLMIAKNLGTFMKSLEKYGLLRASRSEAVNMLHKIKVIRSGPYLVMSDGEHVQITGKNRDNFPF
jgi:two-component system LytT family response regulator